MRDWEIRVKRGVVAVTVMSLLAVVWGIVAPPAESHTRSCTHGDHWRGHGGEYLLMFRLHYEHPSRRIGHVHMMDLYTGRNFFGTYEDLRQRKHVECSGHSDPRILRPADVPSIIPGHPRINPLR